jgi:hypothetical protein
MDPQEARRLQASIIAAATQRAVFIYSHVTEFAGVATRSAVQFSVKNNRGANSHSYVNIYEIVPTFSESKMLLRRRDRSVYGSWREMMLTPDCPSTARNWWKQHEANFRDPNFSLVSPNSPRRLAFYRALSPLSW